MKNQSKKDIVLVAINKSENKELQSYINKGLWGLEGSTGKSMMEALKEGRCILPEERFKDYWGNVIPSIHDVKKGSTGSLDLAIKYYNL